MRCPIDNSQLVMAERHGVEIDYCPTCRGVWLDRGELDKIIDRAAVPPTPPVALQEPPRPAREVSRGHDEPRRRHREKDDDDDDDDRHPRRKRRESFLSDLFDF